MAARAFGVDGSVASKTGRVSFRQSWLQRCWCLGRRFHSSADQLCLALTTFAYASVVCRPQSEIKDAPVAGAGFANVQTNEVTFRCPRYIRRYTVAGFT